MKISTFALLWCPILLFIFVSMHGCGSPESSLDEAATLFVDAQQALADGDPEKAMELLTASIEMRPDPWALCERAKLHAESGNDEQAHADIEAGLELDAEHGDLLWLQKELKKTQRRRFQGRTGTPPSASK